VVDTGATTTTVFSEFIEITCGSLKEGTQCETANGPRIPFLMKKSTFLFRTTKGEILDIQPKHIDVLDTENPAIAGLLGMDIIQFFKKTVLTQTRIDFIK